MYSTSATYTPPPIQQTSPSFHNKYDYVTMVKSPHPYGYNNVPPLSVDPNQSQQPVQQPAMYGHHASITHPGNILTPSATPPSINQHQFSSATSWPSSASNYSDLHFNDPSSYARNSNQPLPPRSTPSLSHESSSMMYIPTYDPSSFQPPANNTMSFPATTPPLPTPQSQRPQETHPMYRQSNQAVAAAAMSYSRPKLSTTIWEDEGTVCYQVDAKGICVARRQDNDMVNGTKLLNVAGMSRGKRDGILKNEKGRVVVKVGAMHLKGVWVTFSRAKTLASQYKISDILYPLFVNDPSVFLYSNAVPNTPRPSSFGRHTPQRSVSSNTSITWQSNSSNENDQGFDTGFQSSTQPQQQASVQTDILSSDNSYILDYSRNNHHQQFVTGIVPPSSSAFSTGQVPDYFAEEDDARYKFEKM